MNRISKLLSARDIVLDVPATSKKRLLEHAALMFENEHRLERNKVFDSLFARERLGSTGLGQGVAIPHGRIKGLKSPLIAVIRAETPVPFESPDAQPVRLRDTVAAMDADGRWWTQLALWGSPPTLQRPRWLQRP